MYSNELEKQNTLLIAFGFSFRDEHILEITRRSLINPSLLLYAFYYDETFDDLKEIFAFEACQCFLGQNERWKTWLVGI